MYVIESARVIVMSHSDQCMASLKVHAHTLEGEMA